MDLSELKVTMERLGAPQTHLSLKSMIKELDEDQDGKLSFREVIIIKIMFCFDRALLGLIKLDTLSAT